MNQKTVKEKAVFPMQVHTEIINYLAKKIEARNYLEIGVYNTEHNFDRIKVEQKESVDPDINAKATYLMTSDVFFDTFDRLGKYAEKPLLYDLIFIDGLHHANQVKKDFENALRYITDRGYIIIHDCNPHKEEITQVPRATREWCGDVYKFACTLGSYDKIDFLTVDMDYGCCVVWKDKKTTGVPVPEITWEYFVENKQKLLRLVDFEMFKALV